MSRIIASDHEPVEGTLRGNMSDGLRARVKARSDGHCAYPGCEITEGLEIDHIVALGLGGRDREDNLEALCGPHHLRKTKADVTAIAKAKRIKLKHETPLSEIPGRGDGFNSRRRRFFEGER